MRYGYSPSTREIADAVGLASTSSVSRHLRVLEERDFLRRGGATTRRSTSGCSWSPRPAPRATRPLWACPCSARSPPAARSWPRRRSTRR
ncbi:LexA family protein [Actinoplanes nipponensis]|uniref:LexA family protein n=1 Tax=Actinoplanes nipponensis TaxID=135950 RepID=UPI003F68FD64